MWKPRSNELEIIDLGPDHYNLEEYHHCLANLDKIGRWLGGDNATLAVLNKLEPKPLSILDVGCGGGHFTARMASRFPEAKVVGIDLNPQAILFARKQMSSMLNPPNNLIFEVRGQEKLDEPSKSYDVIVATLICHHLTHDHLIDFISRACKIARRKVIINDLHRHPLAYYLFKMISPIFFSNRLICHDGPLSVLRSFQYDEWVDCLAKSGLTPTQYRISWRWAFRWIIEINCERLQA